jgi:hypothetical protein
VTLLEQFLAEECTPYVRRVLLQAIADATVARPHVELNRFEVTVDREHDAVILEDVLDPTDAGSQTIRLPVFLEALQ